MSNIKNKKYTRINNTCYQESKIYKNQKYTRNQLRSPNTTGHPGRIPSPTPSRKYIKQNISQVLRQTTTYRLPIPTTSCEL